MLFLASGVSKWIFVPSWKAFSTWLAKQLARLNQRMSLAVASARRGSTPRYTGRVVSKPKCGSPCLRRSQLPMDGTMWNSA